MAYQSTSNLLPQVEDVTHLNEGLPPMCPSRKSFTIAPIRNHPILKEYLHSPSANVIPGAARPLPTRYTEMDPWGFGDEVTEDPYWHISRKSSTWNTRDDRASASETIPWHSFSNVCNRFADGVFGPEQFRDAPHDFSRVNGCLVSCVPRGLLPSGFRTPNRSRASSPPGTRAGSPMLPPMFLAEFTSFDRHLQDSSDESDRSGESRDFEPEDAHAEDFNQHASPFEDLTRHHHWSNEDIIELEDGEGAESGDGKGDSGYSSHDERPDNDQQEVPEVTNQQESTSRPPGKENSNPVQASVEAGPSVKKSTPPVDESPLRKISSTFATKSLHVMPDRICYDSRHDQPMKARVRLTTKRPLTEASGRDFSKKIKVLLSQDKKE